MQIMHLPWAWVSLALLGAFHGVNPAMGWLFAVALGFQERRTGAVVRALGPIALGHALAIAMVAVPFAFLGLVVPQTGLLVAIGLLLLGFAAYKVVTRFRHPRWVGMRVKSHELAFWSFLMATAHGAGLMIVPVLVAMQDAAPPAVMASSDHAHHMHMAQMASADGAASGDAIGPAIAAITLHAAAMLLVTAGIALIVFRKVGVDVLRRAWINLDLIWIGTFVLVGSVTLGFGIRGMLA